MFQAPNSAPAILRIAALVLFYLEPSFSQTSSIERQHFELSDVFELEFASDPKLSPDGATVAYVRNSMDKMTDRRRSSLWAAGTDGSSHRPITDGHENAFSPRWSPDGTRLLYLSKKAESDSTQIYVRWLDSGQSARLTTVEKPPGQIAWSPDSERIAFTMFVPQKEKPFIELPAKPKDAAWAEPAKAIDRMIYRSDGRGYLDKGFTHLFVVPADGGTPRQVTSGNYHVSGAPAWTPDGSSLLFSSNRNDDFGSTIPETRRSTKCD